jgi:hypothetical protein
LPHNRRDGVSTAHCAAHTEDVPDEEDRPRDASSSADLPAGQDAEPDWMNVVIPDDISELARDIAAYHREVRRVRLRRRVQSLLQRPGATPLLVLTIAALLGGLVAVLLTVMGPNTVSRAPAPAPLAAPTTAVGAVGGLVPAATLQSGVGTPTSSRDPALRPAVLALVPVECNCRDLLNTLAGQAFSERLPLAIVVPAASDPSLVAASQTLDRGAPEIYYDPSAALAGGIGGRGVTVVLVNRDGTIYDIQRGVTNPDATSLEASLQSMMLPAAPRS